jgi:rhamnulokinase
VDAAPLLLDGDMPEMLNDELRKAGCAAIENCTGNEPRFARLIFESLAQRYAAVLRNLESLTARPVRRIHILGGGSRNKLLTELTARYTGLPVETGHVESSTIGNFAVQLAAAESREERLDRESIRRWAERLS